MGWNAGWAAAVAASKRDADVDNSAVNSRGNDSTPIPPTRKSAQTTHSGARATIGPRFSSHFRAVLREYAPSAKDGTTQRRTTLQTAKSPPVPRHHQPPAPPSR